VGFIPASASSAVGKKENPGSTVASCEECVADALKAGYRFLDCAEFYGNEAEVIITKMSCREEPNRNFRPSLTRLAAPYIDQG